MPLPEWDIESQAMPHLQSLVRANLTQADIDALLPVLMSGLRDSPDPDRALSAFARWVSACVTPQTILPLLHQPHVLARFCFVTGSSQYFADLLARYPDDIDILASPAKYGERKSPARRYLEISQLTASSDTPEQQCDLLRRWKAREMLRIGARDLLELDDMPTSAREFSNLADACVQRALDLAYAIVEEKEDGDKNKENAGAAAPLLSFKSPLAVIALGKLGGQELNYSSDIDLLFVHEDDLPPQTQLPDGRRMETPVYLTRLAENIIRVLSDQTAQGHVFRVDMRLRPEGRFGALTRSLSGCRAYYEKWAENWERQALIKARVAAGNRALGDAFLDSVAPLVYRRQITGAFLNDMRLNKRRIEQTSARRGVEQTNIKTGIGGIRDIEFIVQMLQLEFGGRQPRLRSPNTLTTLTRLNEANYLTDRESEELGDDYTWLRTLEHRLQLLHNAQTQTLPPQSDELARTHLARSMRYATREDFEADLAYRRTRTRQYLNVLFYDQERRFYPHFPADPDPLWQNVENLLDALDAPDARLALGARLTQAGFRDAPNTPCACWPCCVTARSSKTRRLSRPPSSERARALSAGNGRAQPRPGCRACGGRSPGGSVSRHAVQAVSGPSRPDVARGAACECAAADRAARAASGVDAASSRRRGRGSRRRPRTFLTSWRRSSRQPIRKRTPCRARRSRSPMSGNWRARIATLPTPNARWKMIALFYQRERLRLAAADIWDEADVADVMLGLTRLAEATSASAINRMQPGVRALAHPDPATAQRMLAQVAIVALGRLGGAELNYGSDWDLLFVYDVERPRATERGAGRAQRTGQRTGAGRSRRRGRPEPARREYQRRYTPAPLGTAGQRRVFHARLHRLFRPSCRDMGAAGRAQSPVCGWQCARGPTPGTHSARREWRARRHLGGRRPDTGHESPHRKRAPRTAGERDTDLKLGHGGLSDIEWIVQRLQLRYGPAFSRRSRTEHARSRSTRSRPCRALDKSEVGRSRSRVSPAHAHTQRHDPAGRNAPGRVSRRR